MRYDSGIANSVIQIERSLLNLKTVGFSLLGNDSLEKHQKRIARLELKLEKFKRLETLIWGMYPFIIATIFGAAKFL